MNGEHGSTRVLKHMNGKKKFTIRIYDVEGKLYAIYKFTICEPVC